MCERNIDWFPLVCPDQGAGHNPGMCPDQDRTNDLSFHGMMPNPLSHISKGSLNFLYNKIIYNIDGYEN